MRVCCDKTTIHGITRFHYKVALCLGFWHGKFGDEIRRTFLTGAISYYMNSFGWIVKFSYTRYWAFGPELIPVYRQSARRWLFK